MSDLDIVLFAPIPFDYDYARTLFLSVRQIAACIDVQVETPQCAFSLEEYVHSQGRPLLLRCLDGPRMAVNPWCLENTPSQTIPSSPSWRRPCEHFFSLPGQGSQSPGMLKRLPQHSATESTLRQASEILECDIGELDSEAGPRVHGQRSAISIHCRRSRSKSARSGTGDTVSGGRSLAGSVRCSSCLRLVDVHRRYHSSQTARSADGNQLPLRLRHVRHPRAD